MPKLSERIGSTTFTKDAKYKNVEDKTGCKAKDDPLFPSESIKKHIYIYSTECSPQSGRGIKLSRYLSNSVKDVGKISQHLLQAVKLLVVAGANLP